MAPMEVILLAPGVNQEGGDNRFEAFTKCKNNFATLFSRRQRFTRTAAGILVLAEADNIIEVNSATPINLTVPPDLDVAFEDETQIEIVQIGAGQFTLVQGAGVTINRPSTLTSRTQWSSGTLRKRGTNLWHFAGDTT